MWIYFAELQNADAYIKIGLSADPLARITSLNGGSPYPVHLIKSIRGNAETEEYLHYHFRALRKGGEWFYPGDELLLYIRGLPDQTPAPKPTGRRLRVVDLRTTRAGSSMHHGRPSK